MTGVLNYGESRRELKGYFQFYQPNNVFSWISDNVTEIADIQLGRTNLSHDGLSPTHVGV